jgi:peptidoglycan/xylan/chitin deacetylase (PgdA/CDA1 family)
LAAQGHEIGCHTASHGRLGQVSRRDLLDDIDRNATVLAPALGGKALETFAYPYGLVRLDLKLAVQGRFRACRGIHDGLNRRRVDLGRVRADPLESRKLDEARVDRLLDETVRQGGWRVFYAHDVADAPTPFGVTPHLLGHAVSGAIRRGCAIRTLVETLDVIGAP